MGTAGKTFSKKCPRCGVVNFSHNPVAACTECGTSLQTVDADGSPAGANLEPCEDCHIPISRQAESCPHCGRFYRSLRPGAAARGGAAQGRAWWVVTILLGVSAFAFIAYWVAALVLWASAGAANVAP